MDSESEIPSSDIDSICQLIGELSEDDRIALLCRMRDLHQKDTFHNMTDCDFCRNGHDDWICKGCANAFPRRVSGCNIFIKCLECQKDFEFCHGLDCYNRIMQVFDWRAPDEHSQTHSKGIYNWCAVKLPSVIECPGCESKPGMCSKMIHNKHCRVTTKRA
jgi:hypothetical protein